MIYKILRGPELAAFAAAGATLGSAVDRRDGFVHFSSAEQVRETAARHFAGEADLWLVACEPEELGPALRWEPSRGDALFPHLYRPLVRDDVAWIRPLAPTGDGRGFPELP